MERREFRILGTNSVGATVVRARLSVVSLSRKEPGLDEVIRLLFCGSSGKGGSLRCLKKLICPKIIRFLGHVGKWGGVIPCAGPLPGSEPYFRIRVAATRSCGGQ
jgi:hypothetical protein